EIITHHQCTNAKTTRQIVTREIFGALLTKQRIEFHAQHSIKTVFGKEGHLVGEGTQAWGGIGRIEELFRLRLAQDHDSWQLQLATKVEHLIEEVLMPEMHAVVFTECRDTTTSHITAMIRGMENLHRPNHGNQAAANLQPTSCHHRPRRH